MWFLNPLFWLGVTAVAAPILVHLVRRTRARKIEFPALAFVRQVPQRTIRRRTFRNLLLLILRCLAILLIVGQAVLLERLTTFLIRLIRGRSE